MEKFANDEDLKKAFRLLVGKEGIFNDESIAIVNCDESRDIKACPGSGKTTTLLAKLVLLAEKMPLASGKGICVLTYTNVAIDEIRSKLGSKADVLFSYPNYFGTMQTFVDDFFANAALQHYYGSRISVVDDDRANAEMLKMYEAKSFSSVLRKMIYASQRKELSKLSSTEVQTLGGKDLLLQYNVVENVKNSFRFSLKKNGISALPSSVFSNDIKAQMYAINDRIQKGLDSLVPQKLEDSIFLSQYDSQRKMTYLNSNWYKVQGNSIGPEFLEIKEALLKQGILKFEDSYRLALRLIADNPCLKDDLSERFEYLFVDEMQDTGEIQKSFLDEAFDAQRIKVQYFGDEDQAIYQTHDFAKPVWVANNPLLISQSKRFGCNIANVVKWFRADTSIPLIGNENVPSVKPILLVFTDPQAVLPKFMEFLKQKTVNVGNGMESIFSIADRERANDTLHRINVKAVGWNSMDKGDGKLKIQSYYPSFYKKKTEKGNLSGSLDDYLTKKVTTHAQTVQNLYAAIVEYLRICEVKVSSRFLTKTILCEYLQEYNPGIYSKMRSSIAEWSKELMDGKTQNVFSSMKEFLEDDLLPIFGKNKEIGKEFFEKRQIAEIEHSNEASNIYNDGIDVEIATVHSVKGETHIATLYMETSYYGKCESEMLWSQFEGNSPKKLNTHQKEALKIAYVAMSRPMYLLCCAIHKDHYQPSSVLDDLWEVIQMN